MVASFNTTGGYGAPSVNPDGSTLVDEESGGSPVVYPAFSSIASGLPANSLVGATSAAGPLLPVAAGLPPLLAVLIELRVLNELLNRNTNMLDLSQMRADELANITVTNGTW